MAKLFGKNRLRERAQQIRTEDIQWAIDKVKAWHNDYHHGSLKTDNESSREQAYNHDFFIEILGYRAKPANPYTFEPKSTTAEGDFPDAVLRYTDVAAEIDNIFAVVELKAASVNLDKPQPGKRNLSPVQQAFNYKTQFRSCPFVVVSNFYEFRLYNDTQLDREVWTLADLVDPDDDYLKFKEWYVLMHADNFTATQRPSATELLLSDIRRDQEEIGKRFYADYKDMRLELLRDLWKNNPNIRSRFDDAIQDAQTIIDRFVFVCFAEDGGLLPDDTLTRMVHYVDNSPHSASMWDEFKRFFGSIDKGSSRLGIPDGYNGGLFATNSQLDGLVISDATLGRLAELGNYNYAEDLPVNILGHIFEQSITDLEEIKRRVWDDEHPSEPPLPEPDLSRRNLEGIFYTADYIVRYMVANTVGAYLRDAEERLRAEYKVHEGLAEKTYAKREQAAYLAYQSVLQKIKVLDPACGSGAFLVGVFDYLLNENQRVDLILGGNLASLDEYVRDILSNNIFGVDVNEESVEITKLSLWLKTAQKNKQLTTLDANIRVGNSLIDSLDVVGDKAFDWEAAFGSGGQFDVVLGNPPYVDSETMVAHQLPEREWIAARYDTAAGNWDLFVPFIEKGLSLLRDEPTARFGFIVPNKVLGVDYASTLRSHIDTHYCLEEIVDVSRDKVFTDADVYPVILLIRKSCAGEGTRQVTVTRTLDPLVQEGVPWNSAYTKNWTEYLATDRDLLVALAKLPRLGDSLQVHASTTVNEAYLLIDEIQETSSPTAGQLKLINTGTIDRYSTTWGLHKTRYIKRGYDYPVVAQEKAAQKPWLQHLRIIIAGMAQVVEAVGDPRREFFAGVSTVVVTCDDEDELYYALAILNSPVISAYFQQMHNSEAMAGGYINVKPGAIRDLPFVPYDPANETHRQLVVASRELAEAYAARVAFTGKVNSFLRQMFNVGPGRSGDHISGGFASLRRRIRGLSVSAAAELHEWFIPKEVEYRQLTSLIDEKEQVVSQLVARIFTSAHED